MPTLKPFKFRYVNQIAGGFVLVVILLTVATIFLAGRSQGWFKPGLSIPCDLPEEGAEGLLAGAQVTIVGTRAGSVRAINPREDGTMEAILSVRRDYFDRYVRDNSEVIIKKKFGLGGDAYIEITSGDGPPLDPETVRFMARPDTELMQQIESVVGEVREGLLETFESSQMLIEEYTLVARELRDPDRNLQQFLGRLNALTAGLEAGQGTVGMLLKDPNTAASVQQVVSNVNSSINEVQLLLTRVGSSLEALPGIMQNVEGASDQLPQIMARLEEVGAHAASLSSKVDADAGEIGALLNQARATLHETELLVEGLQRHWLVRKYVPPEESPRGRVDPETLRRLEVKP